MGNWFALSGSTTSIKELLGLNFYCPLCRMNLNSALQWEEHEKLKKHRQKLVWWHWSYLVRRAVFRRAAIRLGLCSGVSGTLDETRAGSYSANNRSDGNSTPVQMVSSVSYDMVLRYKSGRYTVVPHPCCDHHSNRLLSTAAANAIGDRWAAPELSGPEQRIWATGLTHGGRLSNKVLYGTHWALLYNTICIHIL